ncbi:hypothetical protein [Streptomyces sp. RFCAC02]|uniref:hypothetical protein n=1 Tax=Streptomyces sp. RFCAC02 TaxID=2499143 RepID=UPI00101F0C86|nr:hypothetical protein [Streptomyces sp. RFCAC02]
MKTCRRFEAIRAGYMRDIQYLNDHAERRHSPAAAASANIARGARHRMAQALNHHLRRCRECG